MLQSKRDLEDLNRSQCREELRRIRDGYRDDYIVCAESGITADGVSVDESNMVLVQMKKPLQTVFEELNFNWAKK